MRKLKLQVQMTVNGFVGGPNGELDWMTWTWDEGIKTFVNASLVLNMIVLLLICLSIRRRP